MTRKRPLYYNCRLLAPDGKCLTQCDIRKAKWYIDKELGGNYTVSFQIQCTLVISNSKGPEFSLT